LTTHQQQNSITDDRGVPGFFRRHSLHIHLQTNTFMKRIFAFWICMCLGALEMRTIEASDHLDTPAVINDPAADIGDLYAWISPTGSHVNLVMTIVGKRFSDRLQYVFHIDSGEKFGKTRKTSRIVCHFTDQNIVECWVDNADYAKGTADSPQGLTSQNKKLQVFAGLRDDPFFNNVRGTRAALNTALSALKNGTSKDLAGCPTFETAVAEQIFDKWRHTEDGEAKNLLAGWKTAAIVISIDLETVSKGGKQLAIWASTHALPKAKQHGNTVPKIGEPVDRMGRALTANMLIGLFDSAETGYARKDEYNRCPQKKWPQFAKDFERTLGLYDGYDRNCGNQWLAEEKETRYQSLAKILADDRLWINGHSKICEQYMAVELASLNKESALACDCGGRTPNYNADAVFRSLLVEGTTDKVHDGLYRDDAVHSAEVFPFLAPPHDLGQAKSWPGKDQKNNFDDQNRSTTFGRIAIENLDHLIEQTTDKWAFFELVLTRAKFLSDYGALDEIVSNTEIKRPVTASDFLLRAKARSTVHRFADALKDLQTAEKLGGDKRNIFTILASIKIAQGKAYEVIPQLEKEASRHPSYASYSSLANAYAEDGRISEADNFYQKSLHELKTTSPFPHAWIYFVRGLMWSEKADDKSAGEEFYKRAVEILPELVIANIHLAEIEITRGKIDLAKARLERIIETSEEPEAMEIYGSLEMRLGNLADGNRLINQAQNGYEKLLTKYPLAFADHATEFYLRTGNNAERALNLAEINLENRETERSYLLAIRAAKAANQADKLRQLIAKAQTKFGSKFTMEY
jgi:tetratricopeptide (TPR) repeat protein